ncbi:MAG: glutamate--tRNA ligase [Candidatus Paceibacterota bacterium]
MIAKREEKKIRTRFAPSPTGHLHIGTVRTALFPYLFAKKNKGAFILRIEDTDLERSKKEWEDELLKGLRWLNISWDEGPGPEGPYAPYRQSERASVYRKHLEKMLEEGKAYYCFCPKEEIEAEKQYLMSIGESPVYQGKCRDLPKETVKKYLEEGRPSVIRFRTPDNQKIAFNDLIRGKIEVDTSTLGDFVIAKDLDSGLFNLTCAVDDVEMGITHVIRGEDHIPNTPKQMLLIQAMGFEAPEYAHLPLILGTDKKKLSKRTGKTSLIDYIEDGYLPEAMVNFVAFLGWNPGTEKEIYSMEELINDFSIEKIQKSAAVFNIDKLDWMNGYYIRKTPLYELTQMCVPYLVKAGFIKEISLEKYSVVETGEGIHIEDIEKMVALYQERLKKLSEITELLDLFFKKELDYPKELLKWKEMGDEDIVISLKKSSEIISSIEKFNKENLEKELLEEAEKSGNRGNLLWPLRVAVSGKKSSAGPMEIAAVLGKEKTLKRIEEAINKLK